MKIMNVRIPAKADWQPLEFIAKFGKKPNMNRVQ